eukprot:SAG11_NODE_16655_length_541_cov_0.929864_1_plen_120_part_00
MEICGGGGGAAGATGAAGAFGGQQAVAGFGPAFGFGGVGAGSTRAPGAGSDGMLAPHPGLRSPHMTGNRGDDECSEKCPFYSVCGNTFYCQHHLGAVHVCDQRCRFRTLEMSTEAIRYR